MGPPEADYALPTWSYPAQPGSGEKGGMCKAPALANREPEHPSTEALVAPTWEYHRGQCALSREANGSTCTLPNLSHRCFTTWGCRLLSQGGGPSLESISAATFRMPGTCAARRDARRSSGMNRLKVSRDRETLSVCPRMSLTPVPKVSDGESGKCAMVHPLERATSLWSRESRRDTSIASRRSSSVPPCSRGNRVQIDLQQHAALVRWPREQRDPYVAFKHIKDSVGGSRLQSRVLPYNLWEDHGSYHGVHGRVLLEAK
ncbi:uncharacterized protein LOC115205872 [Salmo trutta]|uniref:uncharacterized protein LOC115205872 n=1 Tax=Salmo trutta TaxID=8032 RepID=UPI0011314246|nr:uncharacterized protein LOC115205872 [Salmo trutta]